MLSKEFLEEYYNNNKSGKMSLEKYISLHFSSDYDIIINSSLNIPFKEKVYCVVNNINSIILCKNSNCKNSVNFKDSTIGYKKYCSNRCVGTDPDIIKKKEEKSIIKFGTKTPAESDIIKKKIIETNNSLYGGNSPMCNDMIKEKSKKTLMINYGVDNPNKHPDILQKRINTFKNNIEQYLKSYKETSKERYGVCHPWMDKTIHKKSIISTKNTKIKNTVDKISKKLTDSYTLIDVDQMNKSDRLLFNIKCHHCNNEFNISSNLFYSRTVSKTEICTICNPNVKSVSGLEVQLLNFIKENYNGEIIINSRKIINPYEIDIYLPELNIAYEFNGLYWHSELNKDKNYHSMKSDMCNKRGIHLIHIWEDNWVFNNDIIKSMILNKLNKLPNRIFARKCIVREIPSSNNKVVREFLNKNHIQGFVGSKIKLGLFYDNELVSLMTFGDLRVSLGNISKTGNYELLRFCNRLNTSVIGGASKLFKYFSNNFDYTSVISYSDISYSMGGLYKILGFKKHIQKPILNYYWVIDKQRKHRYNFRKDKLIKMGYDKNKSEREIMYEDVGSFRIWDCGNEKWILN